MLYHFSEDPNIESFKPRLSNEYPNLEPMVWAINEEQSVHYCLPRDCPRVIYWKLDSSTEADVRTFFSDTSADKIIAVENRWFESIRETRLYMYSFADTDFELFDGTAGYYVSYQETKPVKIELVEDLITKILAHNNELRFTPSLHPIRNAIIHSTLDFSIIRYRNAI